jgi:hypothetical protein
MISFFLPKGLGCYAEKPKILCCAKTEGGSNMKNNSIYLVVILTSTILAYAALEDQPGDTINKDIASRVSEINKAWESDPNTGTDIMRNILSDKFTASIPGSNDPNEWITWDKEQFCSAFFMTLKNNPPIIHKHDIIKTSAFGNIIYELGISYHTGTQGNSRSDEILNIWINEEDQWNLLYSTHTNSIRHGLTVPDPNQE